TRPEGLGGSRDAGPAAAGPRPPYVTEAVRHSGCGYGTATPYSGYGRTGRTGRTKEGTTRGPRQQTSRPSSSFLRQGSQRPILRSFFSTFAADTATATATANALVATVPLLLLLSLSNALFDPIFSAVFFVLWSSVLFFPPSSSYGRGIQQFLDQFEEKVPDRRVEWLPFFVAPPCLRQIQVLTEDLPWPAAKTALLRYYGAFNQIRTVGFYDKLRRHEARRPKTKDTIDWLEKHAFLCRKGLGGSRDAGPAAAGPRPPYVTEAVRYSGCGYGTATPYSGYGRTGRTGQQDKQGVPSLAIQSASV
ncbi:hypothetical protein L249_0634, partial [Ophiocordyceps polyrhachis-furcata BCC 54312]